MNTARTENFSSRFNRTLCVLSWVVLAGCAFATIALSVAGAPRRLALLVPFAYLAAAAYVGLWRPGLSVDDHAVTVRNVIMTSRIPWAALINVDTKFALTLFTPGRSVSVTAAPAPGSITAYRLARKEGKSRRDLTASSRPGDLPGTDSGNAALLVRERWESLKRSGRIELGLADSIDVERHANRGTVLVLALGLALSIAALAVQ